MTSIPENATGPAATRPTYGRRPRRPLGCTLLLAALVLKPLLGCAMDPAAAETVAEMMTKDLLGAPGKEVLMISVTYLAGGASLPHRHDAQVFVYVLEGQLKMQVRGAAAVTLRPGQTFYESPGDIHQVSANASRTAPAKILVFMVKDKAKPVSRDVADYQAP